MNNKIAGLIGAIAGLAIITTAQAAISPVPIPQSLEPSSYTDLLAPVANPIGMLNAAAARSQPPATRPAADFQLAAAHDYHHGYFRNYHHRYYGYSGYYHRHYDDHHHAFIGIPGLGGVVLNGR